MFQEPELAKGYFPYLFCTKENWENGYVGKIPDSHFFGTSNMNKKARSVFFKWYNKQKGTKTWDFRAEVSKSMNLLQYAPEDYHMQSIYNTVICF